MSSLVIADIRPPKTELRVDSDLIDWSIDSNRGWGRPSTGRRRSEGGQRGGRIGSEDQLDPIADGHAGTWRFDPAEAGSGALGDLAAHVVDLARFLVGEVASVSALVKTFVPGRKVDDAIEAAVEFADGAVGTIESTRLALGRRNAFQWEINGSKSSLYFDMERLNELQVFRADGDRTRGFTTVLVSEAGHPFWEYWWPPGHIVGWGDTFVHEIHHLLRAIAEDGEVAPYGATFEDGYRAAEVCDAIVRSSESGAREQITYRN